MANGVPPYSFFMENSKQWNFKQMTIHLLITKLSLIMTHVLLLIFANFSNKLSQQSHTSIVLCCHRTTCAILGINLLWKAQNYRDMKLTIIVLIEDFNTLPEGVQGRCIQYVRRQAI